MGILLRDQQRATVTGTPTQILGPNLKRVALTISSGKTNRLSVSFQGPQSFPSGVIIPPNTTPMKFDADLYAQVLTDAVYAATELGTEVITVTEVFQ